MNLAPPTQASKAARGKRIEPSWTDRLAARFTLQHMLYPAAPAIDILDLLMDPSVRAGLPSRVDDIQPGTPLGQIVASIFDGGMDAGDWAALTGPQADAAVRQALLELWRHDVLPALVDRYCGPSAVASPA